MARKKKEEIVEKEVKQEAVKAPDFGTGWSRVNNMLQAGYSLEEIQEGK